MRRRRFDTVNGNANGIKGRKRYLKSGKLHPKHYKKVKR